MNRLSFIKRLLATLFGAAIVDPSLRAQPSVIPADSNCHSEETEESGHIEPVEVRYLLSATVAGIHYYDFQTVGPQLLPPVIPTEPTERSSRPTDVTEESSSITPQEHPATLILEPDNPFDFRAIEVWWNGHKMGYIPRKDNKVLYNLMKDGHQLQAFIRVRYLHDPEDIINIADFSDAYELRIRVYLPNS